MSRQVGRLVQVVEKLDNAEHLDQQGLSGWGAASIARMDARSIATELRMDISEFQAAKGADILTRSSITLLLCAASHWEELGEPVKAMACRVTARTLIYALELNPSEFEEAQVLAPVPEQLAN